MKRYGLYWLRALTLGAGLNALIVSSLMNHRGWKFHQAAPIGALVCVNCSFAADRLIFGRTKKKVEPAVVLPPRIDTPHSCPVCFEYPCICHSWEDQQ